LRAGDLRTARSLVRQRQSLGAAHLLQQTAALDEQRKAAAIL
jgi:hypothetical protein